MQLSRLAVACATLLTALTLPKQANADCNVDISNATDYWISPSGTDSPGYGAAYTTPAKSLQYLHDNVLPTSLSSNIVVHAYGGVYADATADWSKTNTNFSVEIRACPGEVPIFDGLASETDTSPKARFFEIQPASTGATNVTFRGLTVRNYHQNGIRLNENDLTYRTSLNTVVDCTFENIGNSLWPTYAHGLGAVNVTKSDWNTVTNNRFVGLENKSGEVEFIHAAYVAHDSNNNTVENNSVDRCSGDPVKFRNGSNDNTVRNNYFNRSGHGAIINTNGESSSTGNKAYGNVVTFPHSTSAYDPIKKCSDDGGENECPSSQVDFFPEGEEENFLKLSEPGSVEVAAIVGGDFDQDGNDEILVAFNYDGQSGFAKIVSTGGGVDNRYLHRVLYANDLWNVAAMVAADFDGDDDLELITAFHKSSETKAYNGDGETAKVGTTNNATLYTDSSSPYWRITGMAAGDFDGDGDQEVITAFELPTQTKIYSGNGTSSLTSGGTIFEDTTSPYWRVTAMTAGDFDNDGDDEVITAMNTGSTYKNYSGNGTTTVATTALHTDTSSPYWETTANVGGDFDDDGTEELITGMYVDSTNTYKLYSGNGTSTVANSTVRTSSIAFYVQAVGAADYDGDGDLDLVAATDTPSATPALKIQVGNGDTGFKDLLDPLYETSY